LNVALQHVGLSQDAGAADGDGRVSLVQNADGLTNVTHGQVRLVRVGHHHLGTNLATSNKQK